jgi:hypothetical protein
LFDFSSTERTQDERCAPEKKQTTTNNIPLFSVLNPKEGKKKERKKETNKQNIWMRMKNSDK